MTTTTTTSIALSLNSMTTVISAIIYIATVIGSWKIFNKMNEPGWKALIPLYNTYVLFKHIWNEQMGLAYISTGLGFIVFYAIMHITAQPVISLIASFITMITLTACIVFKIMGLKKLSNAFGHSTGYTLGLIFFHPIFTLILGFGKDEYQMA